MRQLAFKYLYSDLQLNQENYFPHYISLFLSLSNSNITLSLVHPVFHFLSFSCICFTKIKFQVMK